MEKNTAALSRVQISQVCGIIVRCGLSYFLIDYPNAVTQNKALPNNGLFSGLQQYAKAFKEKKQQKETLQKYVYVF